MSDDSAAFAALFTTNLGLQPGERIVVFSDTIRPDEAPLPTDRDRRERLLQAAEALGRYARENHGNASFLAYPATTAAGTEPPEPLWRTVLGEAIVDRLAAAGLLERLLRKEANPEELEQARAIVLERPTDVARVVVALADRSTSHTRFRSLACAAGARYASLPNFDPTMFSTSMRVDWPALAQRTARLAEVVNRAEELRLVCPNGTSMRFDKRGRIAKGDDGLLTSPGSFGNLPAGEVYLAPLEGTSEGTMVLEYAPTRQLASPLVLSVREGRVTAVVGDEPYREKLAAMFAASELNRNIAELGIGTNDRASRPDNILEAEKILGTVHIALGDNSGFGGTVSTPFHEDYVFYRPTLTALLANGREEILLADGKLLS